jgi:TP901 family phage tail tape measure protein
MGLSSAMTFNIFGRDVSGSKALKGVAQEAHKTGRALDSGSSLGKGTIAAGTMLGNLATAGIAAAGLGLGAIIDTQGDFESTMNVFQATTGATTETMKGLSKFAMKMGADTVFSANEAASAMLELGRAGVSTADISGGALAAALSIAATEGMDLADASAVAAKTMNAFGLSGKDAGEIADALAGASNASSASVQTLADGLKYVGSTAHSFKMSLNDTTGALAALNSAGLDGTTAGTSLNRMIMGLVPSTKKAGDAFDRLKLDDNSFFDANGKLKDMTAITAQLVKTFGGLDDATRTAEMKRVFGVEGMRAAQILYESGTRKVHEYVEATKKQGSAQELANARMKGTKGAIEQMKGSLETLGLQVGTLLAPAITWLAQAATTAANWLGDHLGPAMEAISPFVQQLGQWIQTNLVPAIQDMARGFMENAWPALQQVAGLVAENLKPAFEAFVNYYKNDLWPALQRSWPMFQRVAIVIGAVVGAIAVLVSWVVGKMFPVFARLIAVVVGVASRVAEAAGKMLDHWADFLAFFNDLPNKLRSFLGGVATTLTSPFRIAFNAIAHLWNSTVGKLSFTAPDWIPGFGGKGWSVPNIPELAAGGIVTRPTLALIGEAGPEAVVPLRRGAAMGGTHYHLHLDGPVVGNGRTVGRDLLAVLEDAIANNVARPNVLAVRP